MTFFTRFLLLGMILLVHACTGQKPAGLKNSTVPRNYVKAECSSMEFEGQVLSKQNMLDIFVCSGWAKQYPDLTLALKNADEKALDQTFKILNDQFFSTKEQRKAFYELVANAESHGQMKTLAMVLQRGLADHKILGQVNKALKSQKLSLTDRSDFMKVLSTSNEENLKLVTALKNVAGAYELHKKAISSLLTAEDKQKLISKVSVLLGDFSTGLSDSSWDHLSKILYYEKKSSIQEWAVEGVHGDLRVLLDVIEKKDFVKDTSYLKNSLDTGITCGNKSSAREFNISIGQELKHIIEGLKVENKEDFEKILLHGLTKYVAFQAFCEEDTRQQGIISFYKVLQHAFNVLPSDHDFRFLKRIHQIFGNDRFLFLSFLSSNTFSSLRDLFIDLKVDGRDTELVRNLYDVLGAIPESDLKVVSDIVNEITIKQSKTKVWHSSWSKLWEGLNPQERNDFVSFMGVLLEEDVSASDVVDIVEQLLVKFPEFSPMMAEALTDEAYQESLRYVVEIFAEEKAQNDLSKFFSNRGLFEFVSILTQEFKPTTMKPQAQVVERAPVTYVQTAQSTESVQTRACFAELSSTYEKNSSYYNLVNTLPENCLNVLGEAGFVGQIYLWMNASEAYFQKRFAVNDFHSATGVWAPGMLQFIFSAAVKADFALRSNAGRSGILLNIDAIHGELTDPRILETYHQFAGIFSSLESKIEIDKRLLTFVNGKTDLELNGITSDGFRLLENADPYVNYEIKPTSCRRVDTQLGAVPCLEEDQLASDTLYLLKILKRRNEKEDNLLKELVNWVHPSAGIPLPFGKATTSTHHTDVEELVHFLYDLSDESTSKEFIYQTATTTEKVKGTTIDRLEVVIRDIGFLNNFYGAYFKNMVASASDYRKDVIASEKLLVLLENSGGIFRTFGGLPKESKYKLKNIRQTYSSLVEVSDIYRQTDGSTRTYAPFIQSMLAAVTMSSKLKTQDFNAYRIPNESVTEGHNGVFVTKVVQMSGLRHLSRFVRARFDKDFTALRTDDFKKINKNLIGRHDVKKINSALQLVMDKYFDAGRNQVNLMVKDGIHFAKTLDDEDEKTLEQIALKGAILLSQEEVSTGQIQKLVESMEVMVEMYPEISEILGGIKDKKELLKLISSMMDNLASHPEELNRLLDVLMKSELFTQKDVRVLLSDASFRIQAKDFINQLVSLHDFNSDLNWIDTLKMMFSSDMKWESLRTWFQVALGEDEHKLTISLLVSFLGEKMGDKYRLKGILDELFINHRSELEQFLTETFKSLELKPDQNNLPLN